MTGCSRHVSSTFRKAASHAHLGNARQVDSAKLNHATLIVDKVSAMDANGWAVQSIVVSLVGFGFDDWPGFGDCGDHPRRWFRS